MGAWKALKKIVRYLMVLVVLGLVAAGGMLYHLWQRSDEMLRTAVDDAIAGIVPEWDLDFEACYIGLDSRVRIESVALAAPADGAQLATLQELVVSIDRQTLTERQDVAITKLQLLRPTLRFRRDRQGRWNWEDLPPPIRADRPLPALEIVDGSVQLSIAMSHGEPDLLVTLSNVEAVLTPNGRQSFLVEGASSVVGTGHVAFSGEWQIETGGFQLSWQVSEGLIDDRLVALGTRLYPPLSAKLAEVERTLRERLAPEGLPDRGGDEPGGPGPIRMVANAAAPQSPPKATPLGLTADVQASGRLSRSGAGAPLDGDVTLTILRGQFANPWLPFPLYDLSGVAEFARGEITVREFSAANGTTRLRLKGRAAAPGHSEPGSLHLLVTALPLDERLEKRLPAALRRAYEMHNLSGYVDIRADFQQTPGGVWCATDAELTARRCSMRHEKFPYPVEQIQGTMRTAGPWIPGNTMLVLDMRGIAKSLPVTISGEIKNPGETAQVVLDFKIDKLPIDDALMAACKPTLRKALLELGLTGTADLHAVLQRPQGPSQPYDLLMVATLTDCAMRYDKFRFQIDGLSGKVAVSPDEWNFIDLKGRHGETTVKGSAKYVRQNETGKLHLEVDVENAALDESLKHALPAHLRHLWEALDIAGVLDGRIVVDKETGRAARFHLPKLTLRDGSLRVRAFPVPVRDVDASLVYMPAQPGETAPTLQIVNFQGRYNQAEIAAKGTARCDPQDWSVRLTDLSVTNLEPDRGFRTALPEGLRGVFEQLDPHQTIDISGELLHLRGTNDPLDPITAGWDLETTFCGGTCFAGLTFERVYGKVATWGTWDGEQIDMAGEIDLQSVSVLGHELEKVHGPIRVYGDEMVIGSADAFAPAQRGSKRIPVEERVRANAIDGVMTLDARVLLRAEPEYNVRMHLEHGKLEEYARRYLPGTTNLAGVMNGWIDLHGRGDSQDSVVGRGQLQISPARLYELPVVAQVLSVPTLSVPSRTAFNYARLDFQVRNRNFEFERIDLVGNAIQFVGQGQVGFDEHVALNFYSRLPRTQLPGVFRSLVGQVTNNWVGVEVRGTVDAPVARFVAAPKLDDALRMFLQAFELRPQSPPLSHRVRPGAQPR